MAVTCSTAYTATKHAASVAGVDAPYLSESCLKCGAVMLRWRRQHQRDRSSAWSGADKSSCCWSGANFNAAHTYTGVTDTAWRYVRRKLISGQQSFRASKWHFCPSGEAKAVFWWSEVQLITSVKLKRLTAGIRSLYFLSVLPLTCGHGFRRREWNHKQMKWVSLVGGRTFTETVKGVRHMDGGWSRVIELLKASKPDLLGAIGGFSRHSQLLGFPDIKPDRAGETIYLL